LFVRDTGQQPTEFDPHSNSQKPVRLMEEPQRAESFRWLQKMGMPGAVNVKEESTPTGNQPVLSTAKTLSKPCRATKLDISSANE